MQQSLICQITKENTDSFLVHLKKTLKSYFSSPVHNLWIASLGISSHEEGSLIIETSAQQFADSIHRNFEKFSQVLCREYQAFFNSECKFEVVVGEGSPMPIVNETKSQTFEVFTKIDSGLNPKFTFQNFITSNENALSSTLVKNFANQVLNGETEKFLCITGTIGNGKTHLLQSVGNFLEKNLSTQYMTSERFMHLYTKAVASKNVTEFRETISKAKLLLIDDIHFILAKEGTMKELASVLRHTLSCGGNVVITSAVPLNAVIGISADVQTTFSKSFTVNIENPSKELRYKILEYKNNAFGYNISSEVLEMLAERITSNIRELENTFEQISIKGKILNSEIDINSANLILKEIFPTSSFRSVSIKTILEEVCLFFNVTREEIISTSRLKEIAFARQVGMHLAVELTNETAKKIGFEFGGKTHSTVIHACKVVKESCQTSQDVSRKVETLKYQILNK